ncbi:MAG: carbohydrate kinase, partial [Lachnospiraceae bacterium]|nr:carbohydrate kinase [Lachnospiraceae bacterium]
GCKTAFIGKVGKDFFGEQLIRAVTEAGINADNVLMDEEVHTTLALVHTKPDGDRDFSFYRKPGADMMLRETELNITILKNTKLFHFGTLSMTDSEVRKATKKAVETAKESGAVISFDPNLRPPLWKSLEDAREQTAYGLSQCDVLKISDNEIQWFTGEDEYDAGIRKLNERYHIPLILLSMGKDGSRAYYKNMCVEVQPFLQENTIETTGAGDTFCACCLYHILQYGLANLDEEILRQMLTFANAAASIVTTRKGALRVMPTREEVEALLRLAAIENTSL